MWKSSSTSLWLYHYVANACAELSLSITCFNKLAVLPLHLYSPINCQYVNVLCLIFIVFTLQLNPPRKSAAPAFATNLGLLEPKKAVPDPFTSAVSSGSLALSMVNSLLYPH